MEAGKACDLFGSLEGHGIQQSDAEQACTQSKLGGDPTWLRLHPVSITRFPSFRTQALESLSVDSVSKWIPEQPRPWRKS